MKNINIIVAADSNNAIGFRNALLYRVKDDLKRFKELTTGNVVIMGRNTYLSLPNGALPNRENVVITHIPDETFENCVMYNDLKTAIDDYRNKEDDKKIFIIGGAYIYKQAVEMMEEGDKIYMTRLNAAAPNADVYFPPLDNYDYKRDVSGWNTDRDTGLLYQFVTYTKERYVPTHKIFLSMPFTGEEDTIKERLKSAEDFVFNTLAKKTGVKYEIITQSTIDQIINSGESFEGLTYADEMIEDIKSISLCNAILMCTGWNKSKGCNFEHEAAKLFGIRIFYQL